jgi:hypothetical protein
MGNETARTTNRQDSALNEYINNISLNQAKKRTIYLIRETILLSV